MTKQQAQKELDALKAREAELLAIINATGITPEQRFIELVDGLTVKIDKDWYPDSIFYLREDEYIIEVENDTAYLSKHLFWDIFKDEFGMRYAQIQDFIKSMLEKYLKIKVIKAMSSPAFLVDLLENHFKAKDAVTRNRLKLKTK
jgi:hypothetical protein